MTILEQEDIERIASIDYSWSKFKNKTILVSGGTGFIGRFLIEVIKYRNTHYNNGIKVVSLSRHPVQNEDNVVYITQDVTEEIALDLHADYILHLASNTHPKQYSSDPIGTITTNILGCINLLNLAKSNSARFLLASSVEIYGDGNGTPMTEGYNGYINCNTVRAGYNEAKRVSESLCQAYRAQYGIECVTVRLARCFGADKKDDTKAIAQFIGKALRNEDIVLKSAGTQKFSYCYVADAVSGIIKVLLEGQDGEAYNVSDDDESKTLGDYAKLIAEYVGKKVVFDCAEQQGASTASYAVLNCDKIKELGWKPQYKVSEALIRTINIINEQI